MDFSLTPLCGIVVRFFKVWLIWIFRNSVLGIFRYYTFWNLLSSEFTWVLDFIYRLAYIDILGSFWNYKRSFEVSAKVSEPADQDSHARSSSTANAAQRRAQLSQQPRLSLCVLQSTRAQDDLLLDQNSRAQLIARTDELLSRDHASNDSHRSVTPAAGLLSTRFDQILIPLSLQQRSSSGGSVGVQHPPGTQVYF